MAEPLLADDQVESLLARLSEWRRDGDAIEATYSMPTFPVAIELVQAVAHAAEAANHHPDIDIRWRKVRFVLITHDSGGLTQLDADIAERIRAAAETLGWHPD
jgi:4a-hydroxytetrahydrobiopterin dehydratase